MPQIPLNGLGLLLPSAGESLSPLPPATAGAGQAITNALTAFGVASCRQAPFNFTDAQVRSWAGGGATTVIGTIPGVTGAVIIPFAWFRITKAVVTWATAGATTPGVRFANADLTTATTFTNHDNPPSGDTSFRTNQILFPTNLGQSSFTSPIIATGQALDLVVTNAGAAWTAGDPGNYMRYVIMYYLWSEALQKLI